MNIKTPILPIDTEKATGKEVSEYLQIKMNEFLNKKAHDKKLEEYFESIQKKFFDVKTEDEMIEAKEKVLNNPKYK